LGERLSVEAFCHPFYDLALFFTAVAFEGLADLGSLIHGNKSCHILAAGASNTCCLLRSGRRRLAGVGLAARQRVLLRSI
jgi:hypothetical protein